MSFAAALWPGDEPEPARRRLAAVPDEELLDSLRRGLADAPDGELEAVAETLKALRGCHGVTALVDAPGAAAFGAGSAVSPVGPHPAGETTPPRRAKLPDLSEAQLLQNVRDLAQLLGYLLYHTHDSRRSEPGFPDLALVHVRRRRALFVELKARTGRLRPMQEVWLNALAAVGMEVAVWRPAQWFDGTIERALKGERLDGAL
jgi:hypothetical protein